MSGDGAKEFQMPKFSLTDQIDWLERNGNDPLDVLTSLRELKRIRERKDLHQNVGCARGQNTTQFCAEAVAAQSKLAKVMEGLRETYEIYAGMEGLPLPVLASEAYLLRIIDEMQKSVTQLLRDLGCGEDTDAN